MQSVPVTHPDKNFLLNEHPEGELYRIAFASCWSRPLTPVARAGRFIQRRDRRIEDPTGQNGCGEQAESVDGDDAQTHRPGKRAAELAESAGMETKRFKTNVRKLKELGLTESLKIGFRLSPRGEVVFRQLET